jgi:hypothetical protein
LQNILQEKFFNTIRRPKSTVKKKRESVACFTVTCFTVAGKRGRILKNRGKKTVQKRFYLAARNRLRLVLKSWRWIVDAHQSLQNLAKFLHFSPLIILDAFFPKFRDLENLGTGNLNPQLTVSKWVEGKVNLTG